MFTWRDAHDKNSMDFGNTGTIKENAKNYPYKKCYRTVCNNRAENWWHTSLNDAEYCKDCACRINKANLDVNNNKNVIEKRVHLDFQI